MSRAESKLRDAAKAWPRYDGSAWTSWTKGSAVLVAAFSQLPSAFEDRFMRMRSRRQAPREEVTLSIEKIQASRGLRHHLALSCCSPVCGRRVARLYACCHLLSSAFENVTLCFRSKALNCRALGVALLYLCGRLDLHRPSPCDTAAPLVVLFAAMRRIALNRRNPNPLPGLPIFRVTSFCGHDRRPAGASRYRR